MNIQEMKTSNMSEWKNINKKRIQKDNQKTMLYHQVMHFDDKRVAKQVVEDQQLRNQENVGMKT